MDDANRDTENSAQGQGGQAEGHGGAEIVDTRGTPAFFEYWNQMDFVTGWARGSSRARTATPSLLRARAASPWRGRWREGRHWRGAGVYLRYRHRRSGRLAGAWDTSASYGDAGCHLRAPSLRCAVDIRGACAQRWQADLLRGRCLPRHQRRCHLARPRHLPPLRPAHHPEEAEAFLAQQSHRGES